MTREDELNIIRKVFEETHNDFNVGMMGTLAIMKYLYISSDEVTSKQLSDKLKVSSARMTILLKKLEKEGLIVKGQSCSDARAINVKLTDYGLSKSKQMESNLIKSLNDLLDIFGLERLSNLLRDMNIVRNKLKEQLETTIKEHVR